MSEADDLARGTGVGRYLIVGKLGAGGMAVVYEAYDPELDRKVAIKLLHAGSSSAGARLLREGQAMARLKHPNVVTVYDVGTFGDRVFIAMELVEGTTLRRWISAEKREWGEVQKAFLAAGRGLAKAHQAGLVHRDFKPDNVLLDRDGSIRVADFGLARALESDSSDDEPLDAEARAAFADAATVPPADAPASSGKPASGSGVLGTPLTRSGAFLGTPRYMAPEQLDRKAADARSDQFSFCVALYEALYREHPFPHDDPRSLLDAVHAGVVADAPGGSKVPRWLRAVVLRGLRPAAAERYPSMDALLQDLGHDPERLRRRVLVAGGAAVALAAAIAVPLLLRAPSQVCRGAARKLAGVWDDGRRAAVRDAILATKKTFAPDVAREVERQLDGYAARFTAMWTDNCEATQVRKEQPEAVQALRSECLDDRLEALGATAHAFAAADVDVVANAGRIAGGLPPLSDCANVTALRAVERLPADPAVRSRVEKARAGLGEAKLVARSSKVKEALALALAALADARAAGWRPALAEALALTGMIQRELGDYKAAAQNLEDAVFAAEASSHDRVVTVAATALYALVAQTLNKGEEGDRWRRQAQAALERMGGDLDLEAELLVQQTRVLGTQGRYDEALRSARRALEIRQADVSESIDLARAINTVADVSYQRGDYAEAEAGFGRALAMYRKILGADNPETLEILKELASVYQAQGKYEKAEAVSRRAAEMWEATFGPDHPRLAGLLNNEANALALQNRIDEAIPYLKRAIAIWDKSFGKSPKLAIGYQNLSALLLKQGHDAEALEWAEKSVAMREETAGPEHPTMVAALHQYAASLLAVGRVAEARDAFERALRIGEGKLAPDHEWLASTYINLSDIYLRQGDRDKALALGERAVKAYEKQGKSAQMANALLELGRAQAAQKLPAAKDTLARGAAIADENPDVDAQVKGELYFELAKAAGDRKLAEKARAVFAGDNTRSKDDLAEVDKWLAARGAK